jgi:hypothetical protein
MSMFLKEVPDKRTPAVGMRARLTQSHSWQSSAAMTQAVIQHTWTQAKAQDRYIECLIAKGAQPATLHYTCTVLTTGGGEGFFTILIDKAAHPA